MRGVLFIFVALIFILSACSPAQPGATQEASNPEEASTTIPVDLTPEQLAAVTSLAETLNIAVDKIKLVSTEAVTWPNGCLGIVRMGVMCTQAEVPGFKIVLDVNGKTYEIHTNQDGSVALLAEGEQNTDATEETAIKQLAANLGLQESDIEVISSETVEFGDACLGIVQEGVLCAQVVTPGRIIVLEAKGIQYEYHTDEAGGRVQPASLALVWKREGGIAGFCDTLTVFRSGEIFANNCKGQTDGTMAIFASVLTGREIQQFNGWITKFEETKVDVSDPKGVADRMVVTLDFFGLGSTTPTESEQQTLVDFAQDLYQELSK